MAMTPADYLRAARVPASIACPQEAGPWTIRRTKIGPLERGVPAIVRITGPDRESFVTLERWTDATIHQGRGEIVMDDGDRELRRHLPIWMAARGHVLKTGLGLGCVVRGLLAKPDVERITVVEIDPDIMRLVAPWFAVEPRVEIIHADALTWEPPTGVRFDYAWHDIWCEGNKGLQRLHMQLVARLRDRCGPQGAWAFPREFKRLVARQVEWIG